MDFIDHRTNGIFQFKVSTDTERARVTSDGDWVVGSTTAFGTSGATLGANGRIHANNNITVGASASYDLGESSAKFRNLYLSGDANTATLTTSGNATIGGNAIITGDLTVNGTTTTINTATLDVEDKNITVNAGGTHASSDGAGLTIEKGESDSVDATILWDESSTTFDFSHAIDVTGTITADNNLTIQNSSAYGSIELGGVSGGFIDIKRPFSDDYDLRLIAEGDGGVINVASGELTIQRAGSAKLATTSTGINITGKATADSFEVDDTDDIRLRFLNASTFKGGLQIATTAGDMIGTSAVDDLCIRGQSDILFATGGNTERMKIVDTGIDVTGTANADKVLVSKDGTDHIEVVDASSGQVTNLTTGNTVGYISVDPSNSVASSKFAVYVDGSEYLEVNTTGIDVTGTITFDGGTTSADINFGDNDKAIFGAGSDLQIYHDGTDSYITDTTGGNLFINEEGAGYLMMKGSDLYFRNPSNADMIHAQSGGYVKLYHNASEKLATTSTGIDVTGTVDVDGLNVEITDNQASPVTMQQGGNSYFKIVTTNGSESVQLGNSTTNPDILLGGGYAGLGTSSPAAKLDIVDTSADVQMRVYKNDGTKNTRVTLTADDSGAKIHYRDADNAGALRFNNNLGEVMRITADSTRLGIGTSDPERLLHLAGNPAILLLEDTDGGTDDKRAQVQVDSGVFEINSRNDDNSSRVDNIFVADLGSGNIGVGTVSPPAKVSVFGTGAGNATVQIEGEGGADPYINFLANNAQHWSLGIDDSDSDKFKLSEHSALGTNDYFVVDVTGRVGIGTSSPSGLMSFAKGNRTLDLKLEDSPATGDAGVQLRAGASDYLGLAAGGGTGVGIVIDDSNNVGIGTSPDRVFHVSRSSASVISGKFESASTSGSQIVFVDADTTTNDLQVRIGSDANDLVQYAGGSERLRIDSSGRVGIGTSPSEELHVYASSGGATLKIESNTANAYDSSKLELLGGNLSTSEIVLGDASDADVGKIIYRHNGNSLAFNVNAAERMRLDSSGNLLVSKTSASSAVHGGEIRATGQVVASVDGSWAGLFNRETSNGEIIRLKQDDITVASMGYNSFYYIAGGASGGTHAGLRFVNNQAIRPCDASGDNLDNSLDLGASTTRFKDLYLSSGIKTNNNAIDINSGSSNTVATFTSTDTEARIDLIDTTGSAQIRARNDLRFYVNGGSTRAVDIDASGNLVVGGSSAYAQGATTITNGGILYVSRSGGSPATFRRNSDEGNLITLEKDGSTVGSLGVDNTDNLTISGNSTHAGLNFSTAAVLPYKNGNYANGTIDLGEATSAKWKDLYLSNDLKLSNGSYVEFGDSGTSIYGSNSLDVLLFTTAGSERGRFDNGGKFLVGKSSSSFGTAGTELQADGAVTLTRDGGTVFFVNRLTSDGELAAFYKDTAQVGTVGTSSSSLYIGKPSGSGLMFQGGNTIPVTGSSAADATYDLGASGVRFRHLYLSGDVALTNSYVFGNTDGLNLRANSGKVISMQIAGSEKARLDASGNLLVGKTSLNDSLAGFQTSPSGDTRITRSGGAALVLNRKTSDGTILDIRKDGSTVGSIGVTNFDLTIQSSASGHNGLRFGNAWIAPIATNQALDDGTTDLGLQGARFKDLYLSGTAYIDTAVGIGVTPETDWHSNYKVLQVNTAGALASYASGTVFGTVISTNQRTTGNTFVNGNKYIASKAAQLYLQDNSGNHIWYTAPVGTADATISYTEITRMNASGIQLWGKTSADNTTQGIRFSGSSGFMSVVRSNNTLAVFNRIDGNGNLIEFRRNGTTVGSISATTSATSFNTTSDERAKENIVDAPSASDDIDAIKVRSFDFKADGSHQKYGMIAQELGTVAPEAVSVPDDAEEMQSVDYSKLVPMLVKEIQSLRARVAQLEGEN